MNETESKITKVQSVAAGELDQRVGTLGRPSVHASVEEMDEAIRERFRREARQEVPEEPEGG